MNCAGEGAQDTRNPETAAAGAQAARVDDLTHSFGVAASRRNAYAGGMRFLGLWTAMVGLLLAACGGDGDVPGPGGAGSGQEASARLAPEALRAALAKVGIDGSQMSVWRRTPEVTLHAVPVAADEAIDAWERARHRVKAWGHYPVVVDDTEGDFLGYLEDGEPTPHKTLAAAGDLDASTWFRKQAEDAREDEGEEVELGEWGDGEPQRGFSVPYDYQGKPRPGLKLVLVPTTEPWQAIAWLHFGGWNACPEPEVHVAVHRYWHDVYGAELVCISRDVVEMRVARPVRDRADALKLAREQFHYSGGDLVYQGFGALRPLATSLIDADAWYFWWD